MTVETIANVKCRFDPICNNSAKSPFWCCNKSEEIKLISCSSFNAFRQLEMQLERDQKRKSKRKHI